MGFFDRSKKVKKDVPGGPPKDQPLAPIEFQAPPLPLRPQLAGPWCAADGASPSSLALQPARALALAPGWHGVPPQLPPQYHQQGGPYAPIVVNQHYYFSPSQPFQQPHWPQNSSGSLSKLNLGSVINLAEELCPRTRIPELFDDGLPSWHHYRTQLLNQSAALYDQISSSFDHVVTSIDRDRYGGNEKNSFLYQPSLAPPAAAGPPFEGAPAKRGKKGQSKKGQKGQTKAVAAFAVSDSYFAKVDLYANSRLPLHLSPFKLYIPTYPILCLAAQYSERVYEKPRGAERDAYVDADWRTGTKAMVIKSVPMDHMNTIVFAIRGSATFMDWAVNLNMDPASPTGFLDDAGNFCHAGFLTAARRMIGPVARRLRQLLEEDPGRAASHSLLMTGHSAGGAVAALLHAHMLARSAAASSELNALAARFRRIHCVTFGAPPVSLLPLGAGDPDCGGMWLGEEGAGRRKRGRKDLFLAFVNEGDPVVRADKAYLRSLFELFAAPAPAPAEGGEDGRVAVDGAGSGRRSKTSLAAKADRSAKSPGSGSSNSSNSSSSRSRKPGPAWKVPPCTLSNAGRIVVLRSGDPRARLDGKKTVEERVNEGVVAQVTTDEQLRSVIWGDPVCHVMKLYAARIETLAVGAVTARGY